MTSFQAWVVQATATGGYELDWQTRAIADLPPGDVPIRVHSSALHHAPRSNKAKGKTRVKSRGTDKRHGKLGLGSDGGRHITLVDFVVIKHLLNSSDAAFLIGGQSGVVPVKTTGF